MNLPTFVEEAAYEKGFAAHYDKEIRPVLETLEVNRLAIIASVKKGAFKFVLIPGVIIGILGVVACIALDIPMVISSVIFHTIWMTVVASLIYTNYRLSNYKAEVKSKIMPLICDFFGQLTYKAQEEVDKNILNLEVFPSYNTMSIGDCIEGSYKDLSLKIFELLLETRGSKHSEITFRGVVLIIDSPKNFKSKTLVSRDWGKLWNWIEQPRGLDRIHLEDPDFEKRFEVYSDDQVEARYLLTTAFMERILKLSETKLGQNIRCEFVKGQVILTLSSGTNLFEPNSAFESTLDLKDVHLFLSQMNEIFSLIDALKITR